MDWGVWGLFFCFVFPSVRQRRFHHSPEKKTAIGVVGVHGHWWDGTRGQGFGTNLEPTAVEI